MRTTVFVAALMAQASLPAHAGNAALPDGRTVFNIQCVACHQLEGQGVPGSFPPLAGNRDLFLARDFPARVVLFGMEGMIKVKGQEIQGAMPPLGNVLEDAEVAAVVNYVRASFGNEALRPKDMAPLDAATVAALRKMKGADHTYAYRESLKAAAPK